MLWLLIPAGGLIAGYCGFAVLLFGHWRLSAAERRIDLILPKNHLAAGSKARAEWYRRVGPPLLRLFTFRMRRSWGVTATPGYLLGAALAAAVTAWLTTAVVLRYRHDVAALAAISGFLLVPRLLLTIEQRRAGKAFANLLPDAIDMVVRIVRAGLPVGVAIRTVARETDAPLSTVFAIAADQAEIGVPLDQALEKISGGIGNFDFRFFAMAVSLQHATGGNLVTTLETFGEIIRKRRAIRMKSRAAMAEVKMSGYVLGAIPFVVTGTLLLVAPTYLEPLITDLRGNIILGMAGTSLLAAAITMHMIIRNSMRV